MAVVDRQMLARGMTLSRFTCAPRKLPTATTVAAAANSTLSAARVRTNATAHS